MTDTSMDTRWHVTADGTVMQEWHGDDGRVRFGRWSTSRPVTMEELPALDEHLGEIVRATERASTMLLVAAGIGFVGGILGWLVLPTLGVDGPGAFALVTVSVLLLVGGAAGAATAPGRTQRRFDAAYADAGFESSEPTVVTERDARPVIDAPGTRSVVRHIPV